MASCSSVRLRTFIWPAAPPQQLTQPCVQALPARDVLAEVLAQVQAVLGRALDPREPLMEAGLDSLAAVELRNGLSSALGLELPATFVFDFPTAAAMAQHCQSRLQPAELEAAPVSMQQPQQRLAAASAIVGVACKYPGSADGALLSFRSLPRNGSEAP